jgi:molecular chaperone Hsp33
VIPESLALGDRLLVKGYLAFTVDQDKKDNRYQGLVELQGHGLAEAVQHYFRQSEQLPTGIVVASRQDAQGSWHAGCLMLQQMPRQNGSPHMSDTSVADDWHRVMLLMGTCTAEELTDPHLDIHRLLYRLFHEEGVRVYDRHAFRHQCRCSEERVKGMLGSMPRKEMDALAIDGVVEITCEFCNKSYRFNAKEG